MDDIDIGFIAMHMHGPDRFVALNLATGETRSPDHEDYGRDEPDDDWCTIPSVSSSEAFTDLADFVDLVRDGHVQLRLRRALEGRGVFRRFRDTVRGEDDLVRDAWFRFEDARQELRALEWLGEIDAFTPDEHAAAMAARRAVLDEVVASLGRAERVERDRVEALEQEVWLLPADLRAGWKRRDELVHPQFELVTPAGVHTAVDGSGFDGEFHGFESAHLAADLVRVRWEDRSADRPCCRASIWCRTDGSWQIVHHQITPLDR